MDAAQKAWQSTSGAEDNVLPGALRAGFVVHHLDQDRFNLESTNLVLVWERDVQKLECMVPEDVMEVGQVGRSPGVGEQGYYLRGQGKTWVEIGRVLNTTAGSALGSAKAHAKVEGKPWPIGRKGGEHE